jgi:hypothetical protein
LVKYFNDFDGIFALDEFLALNFVLEHGFLFFSFEELLIDDFDADEFSILSVDSDVSVTSHSASKLLLE